MCKLPTSCLTTQLECGRSFPTAAAGFGLEHDALTDYIRRCIAELLSRGAIPVIGGGGTPYHWIAQKQYGSKPEDIIENVVREWLANGAKNENPGGLWFALREDARRAGLLRALSEWSDRIEDPDYERPRRMLMFVQSINPK